HISPVVYSFVSSNVVEVVAQTGDVQKTELASVESTARHYVRRGLSYPRLLCERQDRCNSAYDG
ncbi:MAG TPA: hypothetical protein VJQ26_00155, partial [Ktedonobacteraceae bacterium]|nr:hypothetical protein [Ktedonobacteraceae bacterium]